MKIKAFRLHEHTAALVPAPPSAGGAGVPAWQLLSPCAVAVRWNGGPRPEDLEVLLEGAAGDAPAFARSEDGGGVLTLEPGYHWRTEGDSLLWVRPPAGPPQDGLHLEECLVDSSRLAVPLAVRWRLTTPGRTYRFAAGEPFCTLLPYPKGYAETFAAEVGEIEDALADYEAELQRSLTAPAAQEALGRLHAEAATSIRRESPARWAAQLAQSSTPPPPVSCLCPTYGRAALLEEAIESFLRQDYPGRKELLVLNDYAAQTLRFDHPEVRIVNRGERYASVGEKLQAAVELAAHDILFVWPDDDIELPHRLSHSVARLDPRRGFYKPDCAWFWDAGRLSGPDRNTYHGASCWTRELWRQAGGYPAVSHGYDVEFEERCDDQRSGVTVARPIQPEDLFYIYRWGGTGSYHLSSSGHNGAEHARVAKAVEQQAAAGEIPLGPVDLAPAWRTDWLGLVARQLESAAVQAVPAFPPPFFTIPPPDPLPEEVVATLFRGTHPLRISVVLPALNESVLLERTVEQFATTLPPESEVIVVDNGSTDGSADFLLGAPRPGIVLIQSGKPLGVAGARNRGLAAARGEVVVFADSHIDIPERWWQPIVATLNRPNVGVVAPGLGVMGQPDHPPACGQRIAERNLRLEWLPWKQREPHPVPTLGGGFMAIRRDTLDRAGGFDEGMPQWGSEDVEICLRYWLLGYEVWVAPEVTVLHYFRDINPLRVKMGVVTHNLLRVALLHFGPQRLGRVVGELRRTSDFGPALARAVDSDVWQRRADLAARRVKSDDWLFENFPENFPV